ncbi:FAD-dependent urate hydroxylase HpxO [Paenirhodobacter populi]|uniref:FAD-dependent urate hydroxylase n=1 Tax=Paenirhodobacter populi TaxID=2306993 RepID=A0A443KF15_9RHOB|nr:FAD-dependent urate hydroxylase HpxO [Sinirhodobacter populi]RWR11332.1 FAD-dependent urate hydroxylase HpxO [Sinirhodobacter populi]RWR31183.1 FAD-dependent urate hydroxylase HpxO [Sinirhodobacter populi]
MKAIIIGAGMGGLTAGIALKRIGYDVDIYERVTEVKPVGAALSLWPNGVKCLNYLGLHEQARTLAGQMDTMAYVDGLDGSVMTQFSLEPLYKEVGQRAWPVARADLQLMLMDAFGLDRIHLGRELASVSEADGVVTATFTDGATVTGDLLIGADGAHSGVRTYVWGHKAERRYTGYVNWNGLIEIDESIAPATQWTTFVGEGKRVSVMPVAEGRFYFFFDVPLPQGLPNDRATYQNTLRENFRGWAAPVQKLIDSIDPARTNRVEILDIDPNPVWVKGRVAILGDSAHNTAPDIGQGGCMAMEDSVVLAIALQTNTYGIEDALIRYQDKRAPRAGELVLRARKRCDVTHAKDPEATAAWYADLRKEDGTHIMKGILANIEGNPLG